MKVTARVNIELAKSANYIPMGFWRAPDGSATKPYYRITDIGIPMVKRPAGTSLGYTVWVLNVDVSNATAPDAAGNTQWKLIDSLEIIYAQNAYIERLQTEIITAQYIESLLIKTSNLEVLNGAKIGDFQINNGRLTASHWYQTYIGATIVTVTGDIILSSGGLVINSSYGGTTEHPQVVTWSTEVTSVGIKVGSMEIKRDGIYKNGTLIL